MKEIELTHGAITFVDDADFEELSRHKWHLCCGVNGYAARNSYNDDGVRYTELMHRMIMKAEPKQDVDHIDGNRLNNQKNNLRACTRSQNQANRQHYPHSISGFWGVYKHYGGWVAAIKVNYNLIYLGLFHSPEEAAHVRDEAAIKYFGEFATLNFPMKKEYDKS